MKKYGKTWRECHENLSEIEYVWKVIDLPGGEELWEENVMGRLFLVQDNKVLWVTDF